MKTIVTPSGTVKLLEPTAELLRQVREYLPLGVARFASPQHGAEFGLVMQCGDREAHAIKQQHPDSNEEHGELWFLAYSALVALSVAGFSRKGFNGLFMPCAYRRMKEGGKVEVGVAYFGHAAPSDGEKVKGTDEPEIYSRQFGVGFFRMIKEFIQCMVESAARMRIPIQEVIIGMDVRKRSELGTVGFGFLVVGGQVICTKVQAVNSDTIWEELAKIGVSEVYHMPSIPIEIPAEMLTTAKPGG